MNGTVYSVGEFSNMLKSRIDELLPNIWIRGEVYDFKATNGHWYFFLKEGSFIIKVIVWYKPNRGTLTNGEVIEARGSLNYYSKSGNVSFIMHEWNTIQRQGETLIELERLKQKYEQNGYFTKVNQLPNWVSDIVIITSEEGAALKDFMFVLSSKYDGKFHIFNSLVQGERAPDDLSVKIEMAINLSPQILVLTRGGGSLDDLMPFSNCKVLEALQRAKLTGIFTISAIGHETDHMLTDFVADYRAPTPSLAAEYIVGHNQKRVQEVKNTVDMFEKHLSSYRRRHQEILKYFQTRIRVGEFQGECFRYLQALRNHNMSLLTNTKPKLFLQDSNNVILDINKLTKTYQTLYLVQGGNKVKVQIKIAKN